MRRRRRVITQIKVQISTLVHFSRSPESGQLAIEPPPWSWASIDDAVFMFPAADEEVKQVLRPAPGVNIFGAEITPAYAGGEFDSVASGYLDIEGPMGEVTASMATRLMRGRPSSPGFVSGEGKIKVPVGGQGHEVVVVLDTAPETEEEEGVEKYGSGRTGVWLLVLTEFVGVMEEEVEDGAENANQVGNETIDTAAYAGLVLVEDAQGRPDTFRRIGFFQCCYAAGFGDEYDDGCSELWREFGIKRVTIV